MSLGEIDEDGELRINGYKADCGPMAEEGGSWACGDWCRDFHIIQSKKTTNKWVFCAETGKAWPICAQK